MVYKPQNSKLEPQMEIGIREQKGVYFNFKNFYLKTLK